MDRHHLHRVLVAGLHRRPVLLVQAQHGVDVVEERAQRELALDRLEGVHGVEERGEVALGRLRGRRIRVGVELGEDAGAADDLAEELADGAAGLDAERTQLVAELEQALAAVGRDALDLVEPLERLREQIRGRLALLLVLIAQPPGFPLRERGDDRQVLVADPVPRSHQDAGELDATRAGPARRARTPAPRR